jgi:phospholipase C
MYPRSGSSASLLGGIDHIVTVMLENRSLDHMLGFLYTDRGNVSPAGDPFAGLTGQETCPDSSGNSVSVSKIDSSVPNAHFLPGADPGEGYAATNNQLFGSAAAPTAGAVAPMTGFVTDFESAIAEDTREHCYVIPGTAPEMIMGCHTEQTLPVLHALATGYAVCDHWFCSAPTMTWPNRAFACAGTSQGRMEDLPETYTAPSIFGLMSEHNLPWKIYGYDQAPLTKLCFSDISDADASHFGLFTDFQSDCTSGSLPAYAFPEPSWSSTGNSQHPNYNVALGEQLLLDVCNAVSQGPAWNKTLLIITFDEHGGCYDHVPPPWGATPPDNSVGRFGFRFNRFGPRVPTVLVSPLINAGTVFRVSDSATPLDHTSILATIEKRWQLPALTKRDAAAEDVGAVLTLGQPRTDNPLQGVSAPAAPSTPKALAEQPSHLQKVHAELIARGKGPAGGVPPSLTTNAEFEHFISHGQPSTTTPAHTSEAG